MKQSLIKLQGQFKFDVFDKNGKLIKTSEYVDNFITNSGATFPYYFAFADCFRFLSVGIGTAQNSIGPNETVGLQTPNLIYSYIGSRNDFADSSTTNYDINSSSPLIVNCGYTYHSSGVSLFRQWRLPDNQGNFFDSQQIFNEFMVSPGKPYASDGNGNFYYSNANQTVKICSCNEVPVDSDGNTIDNSNNSLFTGDCSSTADYYNWLSLSQPNKIRICDATGAFARLVNPTTVDPGLRG